MNGLNLFDILDDPESIFNASPINLLWREYERGMNMSDLNCYDSQPQCLLKNLSLIGNNHITTIVNKHSLDYFEISNDKAMLANAIATILCEIGNKVNRTVFTYLADNGHDKTGFVNGNRIDALDCVPCDYLFMTRSLANMECTRPLYLSNNIAIISTVQRNYEYDLTKLLKVYHWKSWLTLAAIIIFLILFSYIKNPFRKSFWAFIDPLLAKGDSSAIKCFTYVTYLLALIPFLEIIKNELLVNLVTLHESQSDSLDDLMNPDQVIYHFDNKDYWLNEIENMKEKDLKEKLEKLFEKASKVKAEHWIRLLSHPNELKKLGRKLALIEDDYSIKWFQGSFERFGKIHRSSQDYFPRLISEFCYRKGFVWKKLADQISLRTFETGLHDFIKDAKVKFIVRISLELHKIVLARNPDAIKTLYELFDYHDQIDFIHLTLIDLKAGFYLFGYLHLISFLILVSEILSIIVFEYFPM